MNRTKGGFYETLYDNLLKHYFVVDNNDFFAQIKDAHAVEPFFLYLELIEKVGWCSREIVEERFDVNTANYDIHELRGRYEATV